MSFLKITVPPNLFGEDHILELALGGQADVRQLREAVEGTINVLVLIIINVLRGLLAFRDGKVLVGVIHHLLIFCNVGGVFLLLFDLSMSKFDAKSWLPETFHILSKHHDIGMSLIVY